LAAAFITCCLLACAESGAAERLSPDRSDRDGLIEFGMPVGWVDAGNPASRNLRFKRADPAQDQVLIGLTTLPRSSLLSSDELWQNLKGKHEIQGHVLMQEKASTKNGFEVREGTFRAEVRGQSMVYHNVFLLTDSLWIDLNLNAAEGVYKTYLSDFQAIVASVRPLSL
jgi:hypothetical protein